MHDSNSNAARHKAKLRQSPAPVTQQKHSLYSLAQSRSRWHCQGRVHSWPLRNTHRKRLRVKAKEPTGVKIQVKIWMEQPQQAPPTPLHPSRIQRQARESIFTFSSSFNRFSSSFFLFSSSFALENKDHMNCHPPGRVYLHWGRGGSPSP